MEDKTQFLEKCQIVSKAFQALYNDGFIAVMDGMIHLTDTAFRECFGPCATPYASNPEWEFPYEFRECWNGTWFFCVSRNDHL